MGVMTISKYSPKKHGKITIENDYYNALTLKTECDQWCRGSDDNLSMLSVGCDFKITKLSFEIIIKKH